MGTIEKKEDGYYYTSPTGIKYTLLVGKALGANYTSDICFLVYITEEKTEVVNFVYGANFILEDLEKGCTEEWEETFYRYVASWEELNIK